MAISFTDEQYFVFENRLASFQGPHPVAKGGSRALKTLQWPHKRLSPLTLARAGFFYEPHPNNPDNVVCFLCNKALDGWEEGDDPVEEHLKHSPTCGWAIMAAIEDNYGNYGKVHPLDPAMIEARKATFAGRWPYESKKGFKCKTKKLVEAGWKYTPFTDADDMVTCAYCQLELEGWESGDNPYDEHYKREPNCPFFVLINQYPAPKKGRAKAARTSKASRLSVQSVATVATAVSDLASAADITADHDDSVMTTASTMTQGGKKTIKGKKTATGRGRKTKAKKDEAIEILEDEPQVPEAPARGRKRPSDAMDNSVVLSEQPATKKRATRVRGSNAVEATSTVTPSADDTEMVDGSAPAKPAAKKKGRASTAKKTRKVSQSSLRSQASTASLRADLPDDDEIDRQLQEDLERYHSDVDAPEPVVEKAPAPRGRPKKAAISRKASTKKEKAQSESYAMFDPTTIVPDEEEIEAELNAMQADREPEHPSAPETLVIPKKGRKAGTRKASKQTKKAKEPAPEPEQREELEDMELVPELAKEPAAEEMEQEPETELLDDPDVSTGTVVTKSASRPSTGRRGRGRPSKKSTSSQAALEEPAEPVQPVQRRSSARLSGARARAESSAETAPAPQVVPAPKSTPSKIPRKPVPAVSQSPAPAPIAEPTPVAATPTRTEKALSAPPSSADRLPHPPTTPRSRITPSRLANQAVLSPSLSPQSSDAENRPPSRQQLAPNSSINSMLSKRVPLPPSSAAGGSSFPIPTSTPLRASSPSKRNVVAGLQSTHPWQAADVDALFAFSYSSCPAKSITYDDENDEDEDKENPTTNHKNALVLAKIMALRKGSGELTSSEKQMTVEEWIYYNAELAEQKLKNECEAMVSAFEREGSRAMRVLEGLVVE